MKADLHIHTDISDGSCDIKETIRLAKENNVTHLGITNHDTVKGLEEAILEGAKAGIKIIPGIEISAYNFESEKKVHVLGFNFDIEGKNIKKLCDPILERRNSNSIWQINQLICNGYNINTVNILNRAKNSRVIYKQHIMAEVINADYTDKNYSALYKQLFKAEGICARDIEYVAAKKAVSAIKADGGIAILAHPGQLDSYNIIDELIKVGLDGIELNHLDHSEEDHRKVIEYCRKYNLIATGGSDFHGNYGTARSIGQITAPNEYMYAFDDEIVK